MLKEYQQMINDALNTVDELIVKRVNESLELCYERRYPVLVIGNGGSAAIGDHWSCDHMKGVREDTGRFADVRNLGSNMAVMTAISNDIGYDEVFARQIKWCSSDFALVVAISSSGSSPNIVKGLKQAREEEFATVALVGFDGGKVLKERLADHIIHVNANNYGVVEDCHQIIMHTLAQNIRKKKCKDPSILKL